MDQIEMDNQLYAYFTLLQSNSNSLVFSENCKKKIEQTVLKNQAYSFSQWLDQLL